MILYLVRHGETEANRNRLALGRADVPLNDQGERQARQLGEALAGEPFAALYSSPLSRATRTAQAIAERREIAVQIKPGLIEMDIGEPEGLTFAEVRERFPGLLETWMSESGPQQAMPGGERLVDVQSRSWDTIQSLAALHANDTICAVTHNFVILSVLATGLGIELGHFRRLRHAVAAISVLEVRPGRIRVRRMNDTCHLSDD